MPKAILIAREEFSYGAALEIFAGN